MTGRQPPLFTSNIITAGLLTLATAALASEGPSQSSKAIGHLPDGTPRLLDVPMSP